MEGQDDLPWWFWLLIATGLGTIAAVYIVLRLPEEGGDERAEG